MPDAQSGPLVIQPVPSGPRTVRFAGVFAGILRPPCAQPRAGFELMVLRHRYHQFGPGERHQREHLGRSSSSQLRSHAAVTTRTSCRTLSRDFLLRNLM